MGQWVEDWFTATHSADPATNPTGPPKGQDKVSLVSLAPILAPI